MTRSETDRSRRVPDLAGIGRRYGIEPPIHALTDVHLGIDQGDWVAITGPSGSGKSTLLNILGCLDQPTTGTYRIDGIDTTTLTDRERAGMRSRRIGFVFQSFTSWPSRSVLENVMLAEVYRNQPQAGRRERAIAALKRVGLEHRLEYMPMRLSGGERQRVAIARAIVGSPSLLLCDEPTGNLDSKNSAAIMDLFEQLNREDLTLVIVTHDPKVADRAPQRVHIVDGRLTDLTSGETGPSPSAAFDGEDRRAVSRSGITVRDMLTEAVAGMLARPGRMLLTVLGVVIGLTALVATIGLTRTAGNRIISQFDALAATELFISARPGRTTGGSVDPRAIPWDAPQRLLRLNGIERAENLSQVEVGDTLVSASPVKDPLHPTAVRMAIHAASPTLFSAVRADLKRGRLFDRGHSDSTERVAVLGPDAARRLGIGGLD